MTSKPQPNSPPPEDPHRDPAPPPECDVCGAKMVLELHCKLVCRKCGFRRDCSDP